MSSSSRALHRKMWHLAGPIILANCSVPLLGAVDTAIMGHQPDPRYLAAIALASLIFSFLYFGLGFLRMGTTGFTAQAYGRDQRPEMGAVFSRALLLAVALGLLIILLQGPIRLFGLGLLGADPAVEHLAAVFYDIRIWGAPAALANFVVLGWLLGIQRARTALLIQILMNALNAVLNLLFVLGFGWGVAGVATGTLIAEYAAAALGLFLVARHLRRDFGVALRPLFARAVLLEAAALKRLIGVNADIFIRTALLLTAFGIFTATGARLGTTVLAANAVLMNFLLFLSNGLDGFAFAAEALVGAEKGSRNEAAFRRAVRVTSLWALAAALAFAVVYAVCGQAIIGLLTDLAPVRAVAGAHLLWIVLLPLVAVWGYQLDGIFVGLTRSRDMRNSAAIALVAYVAALAVLEPRYGNHGLWAAFTLFMAMRGLTLGWFYRRVGEEFRPLSA